MMIYLQMIETPEEKSKFEQLYLEYRGLMFHVAYDILHNEHDAEDAVHQAFVKIAENIKKIDEPVCPKTHSYVVTIVENKAIDIYRKIKSHPTVELIDEIDGMDVYYDGDNTFAILLIATLCIMNASLAFATEATSLHASDDIVSEIQMDNRLFGTSISC